MRIKHLLGVFAALLLTVSCKKDTEVFVFKKANLRDAKMVYRQSATSTRSGGERAVGMDGFMINYNSGETMPLQFQNDKGQVVNATDIKGLMINGISDLNSDFVYLSGSYTPNPEDDRVIYNLMYQGFLVNKKTEAVYGLPLELYFGARSPAATDGDGNIYVDGARYYSTDFPRSIYKINTQDENNLTIETYLKEAVVDVPPFIINSKGYLIYQSGKHAKLQNLNGRVVFLEQQHPELQEGTYYLAEGEKVFAFSWSSGIHVSHIDENGLMQFHKISDTRVSSNIELGQVIYNPIRKTYLINRWQEFNSATCEVIDLPQQLPEEALLSYAPRSKDKIYCSQRNQFDQPIIVQVSLADYSTSTLDLSSQGYDVKDISVHPESSEISFTAFRLSDGKNVVGTADEAGNVTKIIEDNSNYVISNIVRLN